MAVSHRLQNSFSGGEISSRMLLRHDNPVYGHSLLKMVNWVPSITGGAERAPGSQFIQDTGVPLHARIVPYLSPTNDRGLLQLTENVIDYKTGIVQSASRDAAQNAINPTKQIVVNADLGRGTTGEWTYEPEEYVGGSGDLLGMKWGEGGFISGSCRKYAYPDLDKVYMDIATTAEVDVATDTLVLNYALKLTPFEQLLDGDYTCVVKVGTTLDGDEIYTQTWDNPNKLPPTSVEVSAPIPGGAFTGTIYINIHVIALTSPTQSWSHYTLALNFFRVWANADAPPADVTLATPYSATELADIHYVASPYDTSVPIKAVKPIVFVHPNHPPSWFFWNGTAGAYQFAAISFTNKPSQWISGNYPSTCTAVQGRLVFAGTPAQPETVWLTRVAEWNAFDDLTNLTDVTPEDSMEFTAVYRSPIQWLSGHKNLLVGAEEMEYLAYADGIFQPSDLGVSVQSTHGGAHVQPAGFGQSVLFAAEGGHRVREAQYANEAGGWVAPDLTLWHPDLFSSGIVRMVRMRNPHQMLVAVMGNGQLALLHQDSYAQISGWSRVSLNATVIDACTVTDSEGTDVLFVLVRRTVNKVQKLYLEAFSDWTDFNNLEYLSSHTVQTFTTPTSTLSNLDHLENTVVQVIGDGEYLGSFPVIFGTINLTNQVGSPIEVLIAVVGRTMISTMQTLPPPSNDPGGKKRYSDVSVRVRGSTSTIINGERVKDRSPEREMGRSEALSLIADHKVANTGWDSLQTITIEETVPYRSEVLGIFGKLQDNSL